MCRANRLGELDTIELSFESDRSAKVRHTTSTEAEMGLAIGGGSDEGATRQVVPSPLSSNWKRRQPGAA
jgi:hypothetical protein